MRAGIFLWENGLPVLAPVYETRYQYVTVSREKYAKVDSVGTK